MMDSDSSTALIICAADCCLEATCDTANALAGARHAQAEGAAAATDGPTIATLTTSRVLHFFV